MENVCKEVSFRLDPNVFQVFAFFSQAKNVADKNYHIIKVPKWKSRIKAVSNVMAITKTFLCLPKLSSIPQGIIQTISMPQDVVFWLNRKKDKLIHTFHGVPTDKKCYLAGKILSREADAVISVSNYCASRVRKYYKTHSHVIYNGVDTEFFKPIAHFNERLKILYVGRLVSWKRPDWVARLAKVFPECDFVLHGNGPMAQTLKQFAMNLPNLKIETSFISRDYLNDLYAKSDIFLFPSTDWSPLVVLEAMASALPLLLHRIGGQVECIEEGKQGFLAISYEEMKKNLGYLIEEENIWKEMSKNARVHSFAFDWSVIAKQYSSFYTEVSQDT
jgi:glycosyltransferase involved in cell wall biosynthesis